MFSHILLPDLPPGSSAELGRLRPVLRRCLHRVHFMISGYLSGDDLRECRDKTGVEGFELTKGVNLPKEFKESPEVLLG
jgi:hypothetical protein